ncbi:MAG: class I SAM-dependent methyltransferase [Gemmatimonadaceae bacterium]
MHTDPIHAANRAAWNVAAGAYEAEVERDVARLRAGELSLRAPELPALRELAPRCRRVIHLQCSHGQDALSLWRLGAAEVVGVDISEAMLAQARRKSDLLGAPATWVRSDVVHTPQGLDGSADLVYTGCGALPWMMDIDAWAAVVARLLAPAGRLFVHEGHPLTWVWEPNAPEYRLREDGSGYFAREPRVDRVFPASAIEQLTPDGEARCEAVERQWTLGQVVTSLVRAGLAVEWLEEHPEHFWGQFPNVPPEAAARLPHTYSLLMRKSG